MGEIPALRHEAAQLRGASHFGELALATKMAACTEHVLSFLTSLAEQALPRAQAELDELRAFARQRDATLELRSSDIPLYSANLRLRRHAIAQSALRPYFPTARVVPRPSAVVNRPYGFEVRECTAVSRWRPDVWFLEVFSDSRQLRGQFYLDPYVRPGTRGDAWMESCHSRLRLNGGARHPVAFPACNFAPPSGEQPDQLSADELITLFREFGHRPHHLLTGIDYPNVTLTNGAARNAVEVADPRSVTPPRQTAQSTRSGCRIWAGGSGDHG